MADTITASSCFGKAGNPAGKSGRMRQRVDRIILAAASSLASVPPTAPSSRRSGWRPPKITNASSRNHWKFSNAGDAARSATRPDRP